MKSKIPWFTNSILLTVLGAITIFVLFGIFYFHEQGTIFWTVAISWSIILIFGALEISRQEIEKKKLEEENKRLKKELEKLQNKEY